VHTANGPGAVDAVEAADRAARALARVQGLAGIEAAHVVEWRGGRGPGERVRRVPAAAVDVTEPRPSARRGWVSEPWPGQVPDPAPATVHDPPIAVEVLDVTGGLLGVDGRGAPSADPASVVIGVTAAGPTAPGAAPAGGSVGPAAGPTGGSVGPGPGRSRPAGGSVGPGPGRSRLRPGPGPDRAGSDRGPGRGRAVVDWAGPWPCDERWWDPEGRRRRVRFQVVLDDGTAHLLVLEAGRWSVEATYD
jgi:protein ImuB